jgi:hypothetical protein
VNPESAECEGRPLRNEVGHALKSTIQVLEQCNTPAPKLPAMSARTTGTSGSRKRPNFPRLDTRRSYKGNKTVVLQDSTPRRCRRVAPTSSPVATLTLPRATPCPLKIYGTRSWLLRSPPCPPVCGTTAVHRTTTYCLPLCKEGTY